MSAEGLSVHNLREIIRLYTQGLSGRAIGRSLSISPATISGYLGHVRAAKLGWPLPPELDNDALLRRALFPPQDSAAAAGRPMPNFAEVHRELRGRHVTKMLLWQEYREQHADGLGYSQFCEHYAAWAKPLLATMRQTHHAGDKVFVDFSGDGIRVFDAASGEYRTAKLFVAVLGASNLTYVEPVFHEDLPTWIGCHVRAFTYFGGVPKIVVPDNLKAGVTKPHRYDPDLNRTYVDLADHYGVAVIPARPRRPRDKAKVEQAVLLAERWILAVLRHERFTSMDELRAAVSALNERLNARKMRKLGTSRRELFERIERHTLQPLPEQPYEYADWATATLGPDYHVEFDKHWYSAPYTLIGQKLDVRATLGGVELIHRHERVASHVRSRVPYRHTTQKDHMPSTHRAYAEWTPERLTSWAKTVGPQTEVVVREILGARVHPEQAFRSCLGLLGLAKKFSTQRLEAACTRAVTHRACTRRSVENILKNKLDLVQPESAAKPQLSPHGNVRGPGYYH